MRNWNAVSYTHLDVYKRQALNPDGMPSMRQDTLARRPTEVELFAGAMRRLGEKHSVPTPVNDMLYRRIAELEAAY